MPIEVSCRRGPASLIAYSFSCILYVFHIAIARITLDTAASGKGWPKA